MKKATKQRRNWTQDKRQAVLAEIATAQTEGQSLQSVLVRHNISHSMYTRWLQTTQPPATEPPAQHKARKYTRKAKAATVNGKAHSTVLTLQDGIEMMKARREVLSETIAEMERLVTTAGA